jgi:hypothetical protein
VLVEVADGVLVGLGVLVEAGIGVNVGLEFFPALQPETNRQASIAHPSILKAIVFINLLPYRFVGQSPSRGAACSRLERAQCLADLTKMIGRVCDDGNCIANLSIVLPGLGGLEKILETVVAGAQFLLDGQPFYRGNAARRTPDFAPIHPWMVGIAKSFYKDIQVECNMPDLRSQCGTFPADWNGCFGSADPGESLKQRVMRIQKKAVHIIKGLVQQGKHGF